MPYWGTSTPHGSKLGWATNLGFYDGHVKLCYHTVRMGAIWTKWASEGWDD